MSKTDNILRVGVIGPGGMGRHNTIGFATRPDCEVIAAADVNEQSLDALEQALQERVEGYEPNRCRRYLGPYEFIEMLNKEELQRFTAKTINTGQCWLWTGTKNDKGYSYFRLRGKSRRAHRVAYEHFVGPIPAGLVIDHLCRNRGCVNPAHLEPVTVKVNTARGPHSNESKTHCKHGHPLHGDNLKLRDRGDYIERVCRTCIKQRNRKAHQCR